MTLKFAEIKNLSNFIFLEIVTSPSAFGGIFQLHSRAPLRGLTPHSICAPV